MDIDREIERSVTRILAELKGREDRFDSNKISLREAAQIALRWFEEAPIDELETVEEALGQNAPIRELQEALEDED